MSVNADKLDSKLRKRSSSSSSGRSTCLSAGAFRIRSLSGVSRKSVTTDNPLFANKDDLFNEQDVLCSRFLSTQDITCTPAPNGCNPPDALRQPSRYGIRLRVLQRIRDQLDQLPTKDGHVWSCTTVYKLLKAFTASQQCSFTSLLQKYDADTQHPFAGGNTNDVSDAANVYVAHAGEIPFNVLVESLECFMENNHKDHNTTYICIPGFSLNLHAELDKEEYMNGLWTCIGNYQDVVFVVDRWLNPVSFTRLWCLWELVAGIESETTQVTLQLSKNEFESFRAELSNDIEVICDSFFSVDAETAITSSDVHNKLINDHIKESIRRENIGMNQRIMKLLRGWLVDVCQAELEQSRRQDAQSDRTVRLMNNLGVLLLRESRLKEAEALYREGLQIREDTLDANHPYIATSCGLLGTLTFELAKFKESEQLLRRALAIRENPSSGCSELDIAQSCNDLGELLTTLAKFDEAEGLLQRALDIRETKLGDKHIKVAQSCNSIGVSMEMRTRYKQALEMHHRALTICDELLYPNHPEFASSGELIALVFWRLNERDTAEKLLKLSLSIYKQIYDNGHVAIGTQLLYLGVIAVSGSEFRKAQKVLKKSAKLLKAAVGEKHPNVAHAYNALANSLSHRKRKLKYLKRGLDIYKASVGSKHTYVAVMYNNLGHCLGFKSPEAIPYFKQAVDIIVTVMGEVNEHTLTFYSNLLEFLALDDSPGRLQESVDVLKRLLHICRELRGLCHTETLEYMDKLTTLLETRVSCQQAEWYAKQAVEASIGLYGESNSITVIKYKRLARILERQEKFEEAQEMYQKVVASESNEFTLNGRLKVGEMLMKSGQWKNAEEWFHTSLSKIPPINLFRVIRADCQRCLGTTLEHQNKLTEAAEAFDRSFHTYGDLANGRNGRAESHLGYCRIMARLGKQHAAFERCQNLNFPGVSTELSIQTAAMARWLCKLEISRDVDDC